jgi:hypothetical protein
VICWKNRHRARHQRPLGAKRETSYRAGALLCLLALLVQLVLAVEHTWDVSREATAASAALASQQPSTGPGDTRATFKAVKVQRRASHDPLLCPVCQLLSQAKIGITSHGPGIFLLQTSLRFCWVPPSIALALILPHRCRGLLRISSKYRDINVVLQSSSSLSRMLAG